MKNADNIPEKIPYTTGEKITEILCGALMATSLAFYIASRSFKETHTVVVMMITAAVYIMLTGLSIRPELVSKPEHLHRNRRILLAVKTVVIALWLAALVMMTFPVNSVACY